MEGKVAMVTGATTGIGLGIVRCLGKQGCFLVLTDVSSTQETDAVVQELKSLFPGRVEYIAADLAHRSQVEALCAQVDRLYKDGIHILINNAGFQYAANVDEYPVEKWDLILAVSLTAPFLLSHHFLPAMKATGWGRIVNMSSQMAVISAPGRAPYSTVKSGLVGLSKGIAVEAASFGVTCNAVCPGFVDAPMFNRMIITNATAQDVPVAEAKADFIRQNCPSGRLITIDEVAALVQFLCTDSGASMNGGAILMDTSYTVR